MPLPNVARQDGKRSAVSLRETISVSLSKKGGEDLLEEATTTHEDRKTSTFSEAQFTEGKVLDYLTGAGQHVQPFPEPS